MLDLINLNSIFVGPSFKGVLFSSIVLLISINQDNSLKSYPINVLTWIRLFA